MNCNSCFVEMRSGECNHTQPIKHTAEVARNTLLEGFQALCDRFQLAADELTVMANNQIEKGYVIDATRLKNKAEGVLLAKSYVQDLIATTHTERQSS